MTDVPTTPKQGPVSPSSARVHAVLVPGFGGFDALGQVQYYPGTAEAAALWRAEGDPMRGRLALHYFDNLPTAGVVTRAARLQRWLFNRIERNDFQVGDKIALVGHSTGGLDIRCLLEQLEQTLAAPPAAAGSLEEREQERERELAGRALEMIKRVVFLSVPQRGTNIANWVRTLSPLRIPGLSALRTWTDLVDARLVEPIESGGWRLVHAGRVAFRRWEKAQQRLDAIVPDLYDAIADLFTEAAERTSRVPEVAADGREALAKLQLYVGHTHGDFLAIDNLAARDPDRSRLKRAARGLQRIVSGVPKSEDQDTGDFARRSEEARAQELLRFKARGIAVLSFATFANPGVPPDEQRNSGKIRSLGAILRFMVRGGASGDGPYRMSYAATAWGPFHEHTWQKLPPEVREKEQQGKLFIGKRDDSYARLKNPDCLEAWENDGIVNTASMMWPNGHDTLLVQADHADIIGHYDLDRARATRPGRKYGTYDIFSSGSGFHREEFRKVWSHVFDHCLSALSVADEPSVVSGPPAGHGSSGGKAGNGNRARQKKTPPGGAPDVR